MIRNVPAGQVGNVIQSYVLGGKTEIEAKQQPDGRWSIWARKR